MTNEEKYTKAFVDAFNVDPSTVPTLQYQGVAIWDSVGHMQLVAAIEDAFDIMLDTDDIIGLESYDKGKEILEKYDISFE